MSNAGSLCLEASNQGAKSSSSGLRLALFRRLSLFVCWTSMYMRVISDRELVDVCLRCTPCHPHAETCGIVSHSHFQSFAGLTIPAGTNSMHVLGITWSANAMLHKHPFRSLDSTGFQQIWCQLSNRANKPCESLTVCAALPSC